MSSILLSSAQHVAIIGGGFGGVLEINQKYQLRDAFQVHLDLEARRTMGSSIFVV